MDAEKPKSVVEKRRPSSLNALCHGVYASDYVLPWESPAEFDQLVDGLRAEFKPTGTLECDLVLDLARNRQLKHRLVRAAQIAALRHPSAEQLSESGKHGLKALRKVLRTGTENQAELRERATYMRRRCDEEVLSMCEKLSALPYKGDAAKVRKIEGAIDRLKKFKAQQILPLIDALSRIDSAERCFEEAYLPEVLERIVKLESIVDARLDKTLGRLIALKEYKRIANLTESAPKQTSGACNDETRD
jgi:hypothetical protein